MIINERTFDVNASIQRIWKLLLKALLRCLVLERMKPVSVKLVHALLRVKVGFITFPMNLTVEVIDMMPNDSLVTSITVQAPGKLFCLKQKCTFKLTSHENNRTEITCQMLVEKMGIVKKIFLLPEIRKFSQNTFNNLEDLLKQWA
ncbi:MAG: hypothetical protein JXA79_13670 [Deltaproteobacteria bacterium]|nr:hypothetical protein [Deltaproteobacteria bacterium]